MTESELLQEATGVKEDVGVGGPAGPGGQSGPEGQIYNCLDCTRLFMSADGYAKHLKV